MGRRVPADLQTTDEGAVVPRNGRNDKRSRDENKNSNLQKVIADNEFDVGLCSSRNKGCSIVCLQPIEIRLFAYPSGKLGSFHNFK